MQTTPEDRAQELIRDTGARLTQPRMRVLSLLLARNKPLTHHDIQEALHSDALDSVTLYRVLEWLTEHELIHRIAGADQVWRFNAGAGQHGHQHAHFQCTNCGMVTCFTDIALPAKVNLPAGFSSEQVDFLIKGRCPQCQGN
jgi:Fur family transcriptional regulator, ferric uptake regulator